MQCSCATKPSQTHGSHEIQAPRKKKKWTESATAIVLIIACVCREGRKWGTATTLATPATRSEIAYLVQIKSLFRDLDWLGLTDP